MEVEILDPGKFKDSRALDGQPLSINFTFPAGLPDLDRNSERDYAEAAAIINTGYRLTGVRLDANATYQANRTVLIDRVSRPVTQSLYDEELWFIARGSEFVGSLSINDLFRLNGVVDYDPDSERSGLNSMDDQFLDELGQDGNTNDTSIQSLAVK